MERFGLGGEAQVEFMLMPGTSVTPMCVRERKTPKCFCSAFIMDIAVAYLYIHIAHSGAVICYSMTKDVI